MTSSCAATASSSATLSLSVVSTRIASSTKTAAPLARIIQKTLIPRSLRRVLKSIPAMMLPSVPLSIDNTTLARPVPR